MPSGSFTRLTRRPAARHPSNTGWLYERAPAVAYREAYERLTGTRLPPGPPLPALPEMVTREPVDVEECCARWTWRSRSCAWPPQVEGAATQGRWLLPAPAITIVETSGWEAA
jgi:hypothetical protein